MGELFQPEISNPADDLLGDNNSGNTVTNTGVEGTGAATGGDFTMSLDAALSALVTEATTLASAVANGGATFTTAATTAATFTMEPAARGATSAPGALPNLSQVSEQLKQAAILSSEQLLGLNSSGDLFSTAPLIQQQQQQMMPEATAVTTAQAAFSFVAGTPQLKVEENRLLETPTTTAHQQQVGWPLSYRTRLWVSISLQNAVTHFLARFLSGLWIRDVLVRIRILIRILLFSSVTFKMPTKNVFFSKFFCLLPFKGTFPSFLKDKKSQNSRNQGFFFLCLPDDGKIRSWICTNNDGSGSTTLVFVQSFVKV